MTRAAPKAAAGSSPGISPMSAGFSGPTTASADGPQIPGVPDVLIDSVMGREPRGRVARKRARYVHVTGVMLRKVAQQVGDALRTPPGAEEKTD
ncbi:hypothetical protein [Streptomyces sp. NPDC003697]